MHYDYRLDQRLPLLRSVVLGLQWAVIATSLVIILGKVAAGVHLDQPHDQIVYLQKLFFVTAVAVLVQVFVGHRLPVVSGPAAIVLLGVVSSAGSSTATVYTAVAAGGLTLTALTLTGLFGLLRELFTRRIVAVVLFLIAFTLAPTILRMIVGSQGSVVPVANLLFAVVLVAAMYVAHRVLTGFWKSTLMIWAMIAGSAAYYLLFPGIASGVGSVDVGWVQGFFSGMVTRPSFEIGVLISFFFSYLAVAVNDIGAMQAMEPLLNPGEMAQRIKRGMTLTGLANALAGFFGVIGVVNFSLSAGVVISTSCASQYSLVPAGLAIMLLSFSPRVIELLGSVPSVVIGCVLLYIITSQFASAMLIAFQEGEKGRFEYDDGVVIGLPVLIGTVFAFLPADVVSTFPSTLRPILGNGFVMGIISALVLEHLIYRRWRVRPEQAHGQEGPGGTSLAAGPDDVEEVGA